MKRAHVVCGACYTDKKGHPKPTHWRCDRCEGTQAFATAEAEGACQGLCNVCHASERFNEAEGEIYGD